MTGWKTGCTREKVSIHMFGEDCFDRGKPTHHLRVQSHLGEAFAFAPEQRVGLITEESFSHPSWRNAQQMTVPERLHTLLLRTVDHTEHLQQQLETWRRGTEGQREGRRRERGGTTRMEMFKVQISEELCSYKSDAGCIHTLCRV